MNFQAWLRNSKIDPHKDVTLITAGTDGLSKKKNNLMSVSLSRGDITKVLYVDGACPELAEEFNEVGVEYYNEHKQEKEVVEEEMKYLMEDTPLVVTYKENFMIPWITTEFPLIKDYTILDIMDLIAFQDADLFIPQDIKDVPRLVEYIKGESITLPNGYFNRAVDRMTDLDLKMPNLEKRIHQLQELYNICLKR